MIAFADSYFYFALLNPREQAHSLACQLAEKTSRFVTTHWVLTEVADGCSRIPDRPKFKKLLELLTADPACEIVPLGSGVYERAIALYLTRPDKNWSLTDCTSFIAMEDRGLRRALTADRHFEQAGFELLM